MTKWKISSTQLLIIVMTYIQGSIASNTMISQTVANKAWICIILGFIVTIPFILISIWQIYRRVYFNIIYLCFFYDSVR